MNVGIVGCGHIASAIANTLKSIDSIKALGAASRSLEKAEAFAKEHAIERAYGSYEEIMQDRDIDIVYIATPMSEHYSNMKLALKYNKPFITEKSFTVNAEETREVLKEAEEKKVFAAEAIWTRYMPSRRIIRDPKLGGGTLLDIAIYPINFALMAEEGSEVNSIIGTCVKNELGADIKDSIIISFTDGVEASLFADGTTDSDKRGMIYGTDGYIEVENVNNPECIKVYSKGRKPELLEKIEVKKLVNGYEYEFLECEKALKSNMLECPLMAHSETIKVMELMDKLRQSWGIKLGSELT